MMILKKTESMNRLSGGTQARQTMVNEQVGTPASSGAGDSLPVISRLRGS